MISDLLPLLSKGSLPENFHVLAELSHFGVENRTGLSMGHVRCLRHPAASHDRQVGQVGALLNTPVPVGEGEPLIKDDRGTPALDLLHKARLRLLELDHSDAVVLKDQDNGGAENALCVHEVGYEEAHRVPIVGDFGAFGEDARSLYRPVLDDTAEDARPAVTNPEGRKESCKPNTTYNKSQVDKHVNYLYCIILV